VPALRFNAWLSQAGRRSRWLSGAAGAVRSASRISMRFVPRGPGCASARDPANPPLKSHTNPDAHHRQRYRHR